MADSRPQTLPSLSQLDIYRYVPRGICSSQSRGWSDGTSQDHKQVKTTQNLRLGHFRLLQLPTETRLQILRAMLWQPDTIRLESYIPRREYSTIRLESYIPGREYSTCKDLRPFRPNPSFTFSPAILRVCRQLHQEGEPILYDNIFSCDMWRDEEMGVTRQALLKQYWELFHRDESLMMPEWNVPRYVPRYVQQRIQKIDLTVYIGGRRSLVAVRRGVRDFAKALESLPRLAYLTIDVQFDFLNNDDAGPLRFKEIGDDDEISLSRQQAAGMALGPVASIRGLKSVEIRNLTRSVAAELTSTMMASKQASPIKDLQAMFDALDQYVNYNLTFAHCQYCERANNRINIAEQAMDLDDEAMFKFTRDQIVILVERHQARQRREVNKYDPDEGGQSSQLAPNYDFDGTGEDDFDYEVNEPEDIAEARRAREQREPWLKILRPIWNHELLDW